MSASLVSNDTPFSYIKRKTSSNILVTLAPSVIVNPEPVETAIVYCESNLGRIDGKTANGLVRHSEKYKILSVIDSKQSGQDAGVVIGDDVAGIPVFCSLPEALQSAKKLPDYFIFGMAPASGMLSKSERALMLKAMDLGMNIVNGLHEFLNDDPEFVALSAERNVKIIDVRKPRNKKDLRLFSGRVTEGTCPRICVLGTDCAIGKRTTANILCSTLKDYGLKAVMVSTGQTGLIQGARYGVAMDSIPSQFCAGELEATIIEATESENPDIIIIEGQGALSHPAYSTSSFILRGSCPDAVVLQHAPKRKSRCDFPQMPMPTPASEINLIHTFSNTKVIGITINHENMSKTEVTQTIAEFEQELGIPSLDPLSGSRERLVEMVLSVFPELREKLLSSLN